MLRGAKTPLPAPAKDYSVFDLVYATYGSAIGNRLLAVGNGGKRCRAHARRLSLDILYAHDAKIDDVPDDFDWDDAPSALRCGATDQLHGYGPCTSLKGHPDDLPHLDARDNDWLDPSSSPIAQRRDVYSTLRMAMESLGVRDLKTIDRAERAVQDALDRARRTPRRTLDYWLPPSGSYVAVGDNRLFGKGTGEVLVYVYKTRVVSADGMTVRID